MYLTSVTRRFGSCVLALSIVSANLAALPQDEAGGGGKQDPPGAVGAGVDPSRPYSSVKSAPRPARVTVPVGDVGTDEVHGLIRGVESLTREVFVCPDCPSLQAEQAGACPDCDAVLARREPQEIVADATISVDRSSLTITLQVGQWVGLARLDEALIETKAKIRREAFRLPSFCRILVSDVDPAASKKLRAALREFKLFRAVSIVPDAGPKRVWIVPQKGDESVTLGALEELLAKYVPGARVSDVQWTTPCYACNAKRAIRSACPRCWPGTPQPK